VFPLPILNSSTDRRHSVFFFRKVSKWSHHNSYCRCLLHCSIISQVMCLWDIPQGDARNCACGPFYRVMRETVHVGHSTGWCEKLCLWAILQGDARNCACGPFYRVMWETMPVRHSTGWCEKLCLWGILQGAARNCAAGHSTEWCEKLYLWAILLGDVRNCVCGLSYRMIKKTVPVAVLQGDKRYSLLSIFTFSWHLKFLQRWTSSLTTFWHETLRTGLKR
jgi:hypothetical protein